MGNDNESNVGVGVHFGEDSGEQQDDPAVWWE
jgi:hypothetical protein